ncbi:MAG TPA: DUF2062 domain-containing protein [Chroococcales cyanobacterium]
MSNNSLQSRSQHLPSVVKRNSSRTPKLRGSKPRFRRHLQYYYWRLVRMEGSPEVLARGIACGVFAGLFPFFGSQTLLALGLAIIFRGNKILAAVGPWISNPFTSVPIYAFNFHVGTWLLNDRNSLDLSLASWQDIKELGLEIIWPLFVGCVAVGIICAIVSYFLGLWLIRRIRKSQQTRHRKQRLKHLHQ